MSIHHLSNSMVPIPYADIVRLRECVAALDTVLGSMAETFEQALDRHDGDPDVELNGDETDSSQSEDDHPLIGTGGLRDGMWGGGPGCSLSDPDAAVDDDPCDADTEDGI